MVSILTKRFDDPLLSKDMALAAAAKKGRTVVSITDCHVSILHAGPSVLESFLMITETHY
jgi:hypothetical protein